MSFYVSRLLGSGLVRFGVTERVADPAIDDLGGERFSTGPAGEFIRFRTSAPIFSSSAGSGEGVLENRTAAMPAHDEEPVLPLWGWVVVVLGGILILLGILNIINKGGAAGWVLMLFGGGLIALPYLRTAKTRRERRARLEKDRRERQEYERQLQEIAGAYVERVRALSTAGDEAAFEAIRAARENKKIPYEHIQQPAREAALRVAFDALARWDPKVPGGGVKEAIDRAALAMGLSDSDRRAVRLATFHKAWWHQLADDRLSPYFRTRLGELRDALRIRPEDTEVEERAAEEFERLAGVSPRTLPKPEAPFRLRPLEVCVHITGVRPTKPKSGILPMPGRKPNFNEPWNDAPEEQLVITTQRVLMSGGKSIEVDIKKVWDVEAHVDVDIIEIVVGGGKRKEHHYLRCNDPIVTGGLAMLAQQAPLKPKGLV
ncbi:MAG TPA: hypothetical protein VLV48_07180 [Thermoanaerobaculia bacterium]|nr:hypothetical protein [Thermoanaerobaculia bacterium]